ncbi:hypothetical protein HYDPIDRAFT_136711 [Hydnomerulius pinastri MD-312]|uniref:Unplaced genomic scaffold scaffold_23, whole genome shotgun sequence n=1 Tax=Hydnomerulius pinastri MD-312 TaxID=994086 RepID=A0A0C9W5Y6_9AGAM|nr:hypothetical protein HYDPIDRAFT_136711 [Hydnomerulius pinastri MD-312]
MPDWQSPAEVETDSLIFIKLMHALMGLYVWEFVISLDFDWAILTGKKAFRWPLSFYFAGRYLLLFAMIGILIALDTPSEVNCQALYAFNQLAGDAAVGLASINLSLRTIAIWSQNKWIIGVVVLIVLGHWSLILQGVLLTATWIPGVGCAIIKSNTTVLAATFIYSMCFDFVVLCLSAYRLAWTPRRTGTNGTQSKLVRMIFADGLVYFFIAFLANLIATIFMIMNLNAIMSIIFNVPAAIASTIVASRVVRRLYNYQMGSPEVLRVAFNSSGQQSGIAFKSPTGSRAVHMRQPTSIHVEMETFTEAQESSDIEAYGAAKQGADFLSFDDDEGHKQTRVL